MCESLKAETQECARRQMFGMMCVLLFYKWLEKKRQKKNGHAQHRRNAIKSFKAKMDAKRTLSDRVADYLTASFGTVLFLSLNALFFTVWILWNIGLFPFIPAIDPFPFGLLTMMVSLEAIFLAIIVLISQNREARIAELREEVELYISTYAETEITKLMYLQTLLLEKHGIDLSGDKELQMMLKHMRGDKIEERLEEEVM